LGATYEHEDATSLLRRPRALRLHSGLSRHHLHFDKSFGHTQGHESLVTGYITTDDTIGVLAPEDILGWHLHVVDITAAVGIVTNVSDGGFDTGLSVTFTPIALFSTSDGLFFNGLNMTANLSFGGLLRYEGSGDLHSPGIIFVGQYITLYGPVLDFQGNIIDPNPILRIAQVTTPAPVVGAGLLPALALAGLLWLWGRRENPANTYLPR
jgi:hypothetical protein